MATLYIPKGRFSFDISVSWKFWETFATSFKIEYQFYEFFVSLKRLFSEPEYLLRVHLILMTYILGKKVL